jgi:Flp pilus assembly protein TadG
MIGRWNRLARDERGASIIEMALLAPFLTSVVIGTIDISQAYGQKLQLEQVAQRGVEKAMQGMQGDDSTTIFQSLQAEVATAAGVSQQDVTVRFWLECNGVSQNTSTASMLADYENKTCPNNQVYSRHLNVRVEKDYVPTFSVKWLGSNPDGSFTLVGEAGLRVQ